MRDAVEKLEFDKVKQKLKNLSHTVLGAEKALFLQPGTDLDMVKNLQGETTEAAEFLSQESISLEECPDLRVCLRKINKSGTLDIFELENVGIFLKLLQKLKNFLYDDYKEKFPRITTYIEYLPVFPSLVQDFDACLNYRGDLRDDASPTLLSLRKEERSLQEKVRTTMESYVHNPSVQKYLQDNIVTLRGERYVLPVKREFQHKVNGVVHDQSSSGQTLFIEPLPALEFNNSLKDTRGKIEKEKERIIQRLSWLASESSEEINRGYQACGELDFILARGRLSLNWGGAEPQVNDEGYINIVQGRHPLLPLNEVVPIDAYIGSDFTTLVITGPNTGGKTVSLKTIGLLALMTMCGLHLTADGKSEMGIFHYIGTDIGDEQSIEQSLSTFSSHMCNIVEILQNAYPPALVLLDELGAGTDPSEGSVLAMAILEELHSRGVITVATTHINELKVFAHLREGMENASMEFDIETLRPTFRLLIGIPGQSNALTVAERLGMPREIVDKARSYLDQEVLDLEEAVSGLLQEKDRYVKDTREVEEKKKEVERRLQELKKEQENLKQKKHKIMENTREQAEEVLRSTRQKVNDIMKRVHQAEREKGSKHAIIQGEEARQELKDLESEPVFEETSLFQDVPTTEEPRALKFEELQEGDTVYVKSLRCQGKILRILQEGEVQVQAGALKVNTNSDDLYAPNDKQFKHGGERAVLKKGGYTASRDGELSFNKSMAMQSRVDLRGLTLEEAKVKLEKYLDDVILAGLDSVEIIHGKGSGKLRKGVHDYLQEKDYISSYRLGNEKEGGSGVTIVNLGKS